MSSKPQRNPYDVHPSLATARVLPRHGANGSRVSMASAAAYLAAAVGSVDKVYSGSKVRPCETIVPLYRRHVIAQIKATTRTRIDFGLALEGTKRKAPKRLLDTGRLRKGDRITHGFALQSVDEVDRQIAEWLQVAYDLDA